MDIRSYFRSASKSSVVSRTNDSEDDNESEIDVQPNPHKKHCSSSLLNHFQVRILQGILQIMQKGWQISSENW